VAQQVLLHQALAGDDGAVTSLVDLLTPVVQARVARTLLAGRPAGGGRDLRGQVEDLTQEVFLQLFAEGGKVLASWEPERGLTLTGFVGLVAQRRALSIVRTAKGSPWKEEPAAAETLERPDAGPGPEDRSTSRQTLRKLLGRLQEETSPQGWHLFQLLFVRESPVEEVGRLTGLSRDALYAWRSRLRRRARELLEEIVSDVPGTARSTERNE
jgi:RNA polymerase sigma-70 factor (ECF subfamily)